MDSSRDLIAAEVRAAMARHRISKRQLAENTGIAYGTLRKRLEGHAPFNIDELAIIADELGFDLVELITEARRRHATQVA